ncbi:MAG TPA: hypothetical protein RWO09_10665 [Ruminococcus sp.]
MSIKFHLPDFAVHYFFNRVFIEVFKNCPEYFHDDLEIASFYGTFPQSLWNGGRSIPGTCDRAFVRTVVREFDELQIPLRFTFTNPMIKKEHLNDDFCNYVLKTAQNGINGVIVVSPILEDYIRTKYPKYKVTSSTCKRITDINDLNNETNKNYDIVVLDYDFNNKFDLLEKIQNKEKCEILVNACCRPNCPNRVAHYREIGNTQIAYCEHLKKNKKQPFNTEDYGLYKGREDILECPYMEYDAIDVRKHSTHITPEAIFNKYLPMGFNQFKIEGRTASIFNLTEYYLYYMAKPEYRDKARAVFYNQLDLNNVINIRY